MTRSDPVRLVVIGDANPDLVLTGRDVRPEFGQAEKIVEQAVLSLGGSAAITSAAAARLGVPTSLVAAVGADVFGDFVESELTIAGVDTSTLLRVSRPTGLSVVLSQVTDRAILTAPGAIDSLTAGLIAGSGAIVRATHVHVSSYFLQPALAETLPGLLADVRGGGATVSVDTNFDPTRRWMTPALDAALRMADLFFPNRTEAAALSGRDDPVEASQWLANRFSLAVGVKCGSAGALLATGTEVLRAIPPAVRAVDTTGAGDAFNAGFLAAWLDRPDWASCLRTAVAAGGLATTGIGAASRLDRGAVLGLAAEIQLEGHAPDRN
jgi:sugar/nucleoside kinase (ribokinase family)